MYNITIHTYNIIDTTKNAKSHYKLTIVTLEDKKNGRTPVLSFVLLLSECFTGSITSIDFSAEVAAHSPRLMRIQQKSAKVGVRSVLRSI